MSLRQLVEVNREVLDDHRFALGLDLGSHVIVSLLLPYIV